MPRRHVELLVDVTECSLCDAGYYCGPKDDGSDGLSAPTAKCDAGYYCSSGAFDSQGAYCIDLDVYVASYDPATDSNVTYDGNATSIGYLKDCGECKPGAEADHAAGESAHGSAAVFDARTYAKDAQQIVSEAEEALEALVKRADDAERRLKAAEAEIERIEKLVPARGRR